MKQTNFYDIHKKLNAKLISFAGYDMPVQYPTGIIAEHKAVRSSVGVFDVSHMGEFEVMGIDALAFVQKSTINDASLLKIGYAQYSAMCYNDGGIVDDLLVYMMAENHYMLVVNAANIDKDLAWLQKNTSGFDVNLSDNSNAYSLLAVQGPNSLATLQKLTNKNLDAINFYNFAEATVAGVPAIISRTGYTGEIGYELYFKGKKDVAEKVWSAIFEAGEEYNIMPVGLGCRDTLRLEKGYALYGNDINKTTNPIEAGLGWISKVDKGEFNGRDVIVKVKQDKPHRRLVGLVVEAERFIARAGYKIYADDKEIGHITSGNLSPSLGVPIAMGYVAWDYRTAGTNVEIEARGKRFPAQVKKMPLL